MSINEYLPMVLMYVYMYMPVTIHMCTAQNNATKYNSKQRATREVQTK